MADGDGINYEHQGPKMVAAIWTLTVLSLIFLGLRIYCKYSRRQGLWWDDYILAASWCTITIECGVLTYATKLGYGLHSPAPFFPEHADDFGKILLLITVAGTFSATSATWSKTSFALTLLRLTDGWTKRFVWFVIVTMNVAMGLTALFPWVNCHPLHKAWDYTVEGSCWPISVIVHYNTFSASYSAIMDMVLALLPWTIIWKLQMKKRERVGVAVAMSMGIFAGITGIIKTSMIHLMGADDLAVGIDLFIWGNAESTVTIIAASLPILRVLIRDVAQTRKYHKSGSGGLNKDMYGSRSTKMTNKDGTMIVTVSGGLDRDMPKTHDDSSDRSILGVNDKLTLKPGKITQTQDFSVSYHRNDSTTRESDEFEMEAQVHR